ncbi:MAG: hypothetical protein V1743_04925 [Nanoarchaeota archaeon]
MEEIIRGKPTFFTRSVRYADTFEIQIFDPEGKLLMSVMAKQPFETHKTE